MRARGVQYERYGMVIEYYLERRHWNCCLLNEYEMLPDDSV